MGTSSQRGIVAIGIIVLAILFGARAVRNSTYFSDPPPEHAPQAAKLMNRIDPNTASWQELATLPEVGENRARRIVQYRAGNAHLFHDRPIFLKPEDLLPISGIGIAMLEKMRPFLTFPSSAQKHSAK